MVHERFRDTLRAMSRRSEERMAEAAPLFA
jgi:hypothetical protein